MKRANKIAILIGALALIALLVISFLPKAVPVEAAPVLRGRFEQTIDEDGKTRARERYTISAPLAGYLLRIELKSGDPVARGGLLAVMEQGEADFNRTRRLAKEGLAPPAQVERDALAVKLRTRELEEAHFGDHVAEHQVELARAALLRGRKGPEPGGADERFEIRSPVPGHVLRALQESEGAVPMGGPLLEIADLSNLEAAVDVLTANAVEIRLGAPVWMEGAGLSVPLEGRVRLIEPSAFTKVSALRVEEQRTEGRRHFGGNSLC